MAITQRAKQVLSQVVDVYYHTCEPVGSTSICRTRVLPYSSATIRAILGKLEDHGLVVQPHTSAGRVPTDLGYRTYVDEVTGRFTPIWNWDTSHVDRQFQSVKDGTRLLEWLAVYLHEKTAMLSFCAPARHAAWRLRHLVLEDLGQDRILAVLLTEGGHAIKHVLTVPGLNCSESLMKKLENYINIHFSGMSLVAMRRSLTGTPAAQDREHDLLLTKVARVVNTLEADLQQRLDIQFFGFSNMLDMPEFREVTAIRRLYALVDQPEKLHAITSRHTEDDTIVMRIGREINDPDCRDFAICMTRIFDGTSVLGFVGVVGPRRMPYAVLYQLLAYARYKFSQRRHVC